MESTQCLVGEQLSVCLHCVSTRPLSIVSCRIQCPPQVILLHQVLPESPNRVQIVAQCIDFQTQDVTAQLSVTLRERVPEKSLPGDKSVLSLDSLPQHHSVPP